MSAVLAIVGSVRFAAPDGEARARNLIRLAITRLRPVRVISGGCPYGGVDAWAREEAATLGYTPASERFREYVPVRRCWAGPGGYRERNERIAQACTHLLVIRCSRSSTYGSGWTADRAEELGRIVVRRVLAPRPAGAEVAPCWGRARLWAPTAFSADLTCVCGHDLLRSHVGAATLLDEVPCRHCGCRGWTPKVPGRTVVTVHPPWEQDRPRQRR